MSFREAQAYLDALGVDAMKKLAPSLDRMEALCAALDHPERGIQAIHVTGTNGKTSVARMASALLAATGLSVGTYTSPHLESVRERMARNGEAISEDDFGELFDHVMPYLGMVERQIREQLSYFEILTAMFFLWAAEAPVDVMVVEVGLGGRWDATNVMDAPVAVVTNVELDHMALMGNDRVTIAKEKAGIVKRDAALVTAERRAEVLQVLRDEAAGAGGTVVVLDRDFFVERNDIAVGGRYLTLRSSRRTYDDVYLPLHGRHQGPNAAVALEAVTHLVGKTLDDDVVVQGFADVAVPGRLETMVQATEIDAPVVLDVAHNPAGASALVSSLVEAFTFERVVFVVGILADKDHVGMLQELARLPAMLVLTEPRSVRAFTAADLEETTVELGLEAVVEADVAAAVDRARAIAQPGDLVCVTGSHYVVGEARPHLRR